jgi:nucleoside 2-deoxyribosyltransferase
MKLFFAGSIRGGRQLMPRYQHIIDFLRSHNFTVLSEHVASINLEKKEARMSEEEIFEKDIHWVEMADCVIADVTVPSIGTGYEICHAVSCKKLVLCIYEKGANASAMILGNTGVTARSYSDMKNLEEILLEFLNNKKEIM